MPCRRFRHNRNHWLTLTAPSREQPPSRLARNLLRKPYRPSGGAPSVLRWHIRRRNARSTHMKLEGSIALFQYWNRLRAGRTAPMRTEIEPADIKTQLADTFILEKDARGEAVFRLAGTRLCAIYGRELKGFAFVSLWKEKDQRMIARLAHSAFNAKSVVVVDFRGHSRNGRTNSVRAGAAAAGRRTGEPALPRRRHRIRKAVLAGRRSDRRGQRRFGPGRRSRPRAGVPEEPAGSRGSLAGALAGGTRRAAQATAAASATSSCWKAGAKNSYLRSNTIGCSLPLVNPFCRISGTASR